VRVRVFGAGAGEMQSRERIEPKIRGIEMWMLPRPDQRRRKAARR
jgi:hypothetical protein